MVRKSLVVAVLALLAGACEEGVVPTATQQEAEATLPTPAFAAASTSAEDFSRVKEFVDDFNRQLEAAGSDARLEYPWFFRVGPGTDPFARLRTGSRWPMNDVGYILDESDYTTDVAFAQVDAALESGYDRWNDISNSNLTATRHPDPGGNYDWIDGLYDGSGNCLFFIDVTSPNFIGFLPGGFVVFVPEDDIVVGGWVPGTYFSQCLGSSDIIAVTWMLSTADTDGDNYRDLLYVEQLYNPAFDWTTTDAVYLDFDAPVDIETIAVHENGHALGLDHFGGPIHDGAPRGVQPFKLQPNGKVFNPEAVMNPYYLGGEKRDLTGTDKAGMRTMYAR